MATQPNTLFGLVNDAFAHSGQNYTKRALSLGKIHRFAMKDKHPYNQTDLFARNWEMERTEEEAALGVPCTLI